MTTARDHLCNSDMMTVVAIEAGVVMPVETGGLIIRFQLMVRMKDANGLETWIKEASISLIASFDSGFTRDSVAVMAAIMEPWSNGQAGADHQAQALVESS